MLRDLRVKKIRAESFRRKIRFLFSEARYDWDRFEVAQFLEGLDLCTAATLAQEKSISGLSLLALSRADLQQQLSLSPVQAIRVRADVEVRSMKDGVADATVGSKKDA